MDLAKLFFNREGEIKAFLDCFLKLRERIIFKPALQELLEPFGLRRKGAGQ